MSMKTYRRSFAAGLAAVFSILPFSVSSYTSPDTGASSHQEEKSEGSYRHRFVPASEIPDVTVYDLHNPSIPVSFRDLLSGEPAIFDEWAVWCTPCREGFPEAARYVNEHRRSYLLDLSDPSCALYAETQKFVASASPLRNGAMLSPCSSPDDQAAEARYKALHDFFNPRMLPSTVAVRIIDHEGYPFAEMAEIRGNHDNQFHDMRCFQRAQNDRQWDRCLRQIEEAYGEGHKSEGAVSITVFSPGKEPRTFAFNPEEAGKEVAFIVPDCSLVPQATDCINYWRGDEYQGKITSLPADQVEIVPDCPAVSGDYHCFPTVDDARHVVIPKQPR